MAELTDGRVAGMEMKSASLINDKDFRGLRVLRERAGDDFVAGVVLSLGTRSYTFEDRLHVLPLDRLWADFAA